ncbi:MAG: hypothetical protein CL489_10635 [Acidobacteria bacterium]|nr:hypothetical protein [Acidobacteriota bacterium]|tara:strand:+ start:534 stop:1001 length:468 start_codon:yes stop_codon:yes gene_type:complete
MKDFVRVLSLMMVDLDCQSRVNITRSKCRYDVYWDGFDEDDIHLNVIFEDEKAAINLIFRKTVAADNKVYWLITNLSGTILQTKPQGVYITNLDDVKEYGNLVYRLANCVERIDEHWTDQRFNDIPTPDDVEELNKRMAQAISANLSDFNDWLES